MLKLYLLLCVLAVLVFVYLVGMHAGIEQANRKIAIRNAEQQMQIIKNQEKINAETLHTATDDIRGVLRTKYTIVE